MELLGDGEESELSEGELYLMEQCRRLIDIRDEVFTGNHPRIRIPNDVDPRTVAQTQAELAADPDSRVVATNHAGGGVSYSLAARSPSLLNSKRLGSSLQPPQSLPRSSLRPENFSAPSLQGTAQEHKSPYVTSSSSNIDPVLLTKSDVLLKAEVRQKRQRLERVLADQFEEKEREKKSQPKRRAFENEELNEYDVTAILKRAQEIVKPVKFAEIKTANGNTSASDSFDDNTFYSSQMNETSSEELEQPPRTRSTAICRFYLRGDACPYGESCTFKHDPELKQKLEKESTRAVDIDGSNADKQAFQVSQKSAPQPTLNGESAAKPLSNDERIAQLEAQLWELKSQNLPSSTQTPRVDTSALQVDQEEESVYSPPDAVPPKQQQEPVDRTHGQKGRQRRNNSRKQGPSSEYPRGYHAAPSPSNDVRVVRNHITSPVAPQPARVSPLAVAKMPQISHIQSTQRNAIQAAREPGSGTSSGPSPQGPKQPLNPKKRRRGRSSGENLRNVVARRETASPEVRIKDEPVSPPRFAEPVESWQPRRRLEEQNLYIDEAPVQYRDQNGVLYQTRFVEPAPVRYVVDESREPPATSTYQVGDSRRVVTARPIRAPFPPSQQYSSPHPPARAASQVFLPRQEQDMSRQYRASVQPETVSYISRDLSTSPRFRDPGFGPGGNELAIMPPPPRRIVIDQHGNQFYEQERIPLPRERQTSVVPIHRPAYPDEPYEMQGPRHSIARIPQHASTFYGNEAQSQRSGGTRVVDYPPVHANGSYEEVRPVQRMGRMSSVRPIGGAYEAVPEQMTRVQSVRPERGRIVSLGGREVAPGSRAVSVRPDDSYGRPMEYVPAPGHRTQY